MMYSSDYIFVLCVLASTTVASDCPTGCSCRGPSNSQWHTAICYGENGPSKDIPPTITTMELRRLPISSMPRFLKHAPDVTDLIIHKSNSEELQSVPANLFTGMKHLKVLTFQTSKQGGVLHGLAASLHGLEELRLIDLGGYRLECNCELPHWIRQNHVILLGIPSLSPSTRCKEAGFTNDVYKADELIKVCGEYKNTKHPQVAKTSGEHPTKETTTLSSENKEHSSKSTEQKGEKDEGEEPTKEDDRGEEGGSKEEQQQHDDMDDDEEEEDDDGDDDDKNPEPTKSRDKHLKYMLLDRNIGNHVLPFDSRFKGKSRTAKPTIPFHRGEPKREKYNTDAAGSAAESGLTSELNFFKDIMPAESENDVAKEYQALLRSLFAVGKRVNSPPTGEPEVGTPTRANADDTTQSKNSETDEATEYYDNEKPIKSGSEPTTAPTITIIATPQEVTLSNESGRTTEYYDTEKPIQSESKTTPTHSSALSSDLTSVTEDNETIVPKTNSHAEIEKKSPTEGSKFERVSKTESSRSLKAGGSTVQEDIMKLLMSEGLRKSFLKRISAGGLGSIIDSPVDVQLHPIDPFELQLLIQYIQHVSGQHMDGVDH